MRVLVVCLCALLAVSACSGDGDSSGGPAAKTTTVVPRERVDLSSATSASFEAGGSVGHVWVVGAAPGAELQLVNDGDELVATATADASGSVIFRDVPVGTGYRVASGGAVSERVDVTAPDDHPDQSFYDERDVAEGYGYLETRDGTLLSMTVKLPGPVEDGPYPTVVEYSGYSPANPDSPQPSTLIAQNLGFATVGVNMRGTGCSGGAFEFFEPLQSTDGYDIVETIAAQPWVEHGAVGMIGLSYPGITQLFVAQTQPPHLAAIAPLSVIADTARGTLAPGGILNNGFAVEWAEDRRHDAQPAPESGQGWAGDRIEAGDATCAANQALRLQSPDIIDTIDDNRYWTDEIAAPLAPELFAHRIEVPVFLAGAWQDEQVGPYFANMIDELLAANDDVYAVLTNGGHAEPLMPVIFDRWLQFLQTFVARDEPARPVAAAVAAATIGSAAFATPVELPPETPIDFEDEPRIRVLFENGAGAAPGAPVPVFEATFDEWPPAAGEPWYFDDAGRLVDTAPEGESEASYRYDASRAQMTTFDGSDSEIWHALPAWNWAPPADGTALAYDSLPLGDDVVMVGGGSVDLWVQATADDLDFQVTLTEIRPDGNEVFVQSGWLRASHRALHEDATMLRPLHTHTEADAAPLPSGEWTEARVELFPFAHAFRAGSQIRIIVDAPGGSRPRWKFEALEPEGETTVRIAHGGDRASRVVLPVVDGVDVPALYPPCPSLRGQPCRPTAEL